MVVLVSAVNSHNKVAAPSSNNSSSNSKAVEVATEAPNNANPVTADTATPLVAALLDLRDQPPPTGKL